ncbi:related to integral membrane [Lecanosticta acicola]|uniref:Related to integral membrane n=1 Tax=Lecanosticta acicola TaxID=111012 RepID=A0AAI8YUX5_9PEZI|nr:related to integral membrane [Lecanosticta acicola]
MATSGHASSTSVVGVTVAFTVVAFVVTVLRLITRISIVRKVGLDDLVITLAVLFSIVLTVTMGEQVKYGMGRHDDTISTEDNVKNLVWFWASVWIYYPALCFTKLSILLQYLRIFPERNVRIACYALMGLIVAWTLWAFFSALFACQPIRSFWDKSVPASCLNRLAVWFANASFNILTDIMTALLPLPVLNSLNLPKRQKIILMVVFGLGGVTCVISILRLSALYAISKSSDVSWDNPLAAIWSSLEVNVGILCSCLPTLKGLVTRYFPTLFSSRSWSSRAAGKRHTQALELHGGGGVSHASCTANEPEEEVRAPGGRMARLGRKLGGGGPHLKEMMDKERDAESSETERASKASGGPRSPPAIIVTRVVEQAAERDEELASDESESLRELVPVSTERMPHSRL